MKRRSFVILAAIVACICALPVSRSVHAQFEAGDVQFVKDVLPVLREKCWTCHGDDQGDIRGGLDMLTRASLLKGGDSEEPSLVPGKPDESPIYLAVLRQEEVWSAMPPKENDALTSQQIAALKLWIEKGAAWPNATTIEAIKKEFQSEWDAEGGEQVATSGGLADEWTNRRYEPENLWAYQPLWKDHDGKLSASGRNGIDVLIEDRLQQVGLPTAPRADRRTLIRRATYDLTGLPPSGEEIETFLADPADDQVAFAKVVERLLASPHYGEQMARHWLDVVRYADTSGLANDFERGNAWRYRDYVVRAFNDDKPYDLFIKEQLAGDEMEGNDPEKIIATGFLRMGPWELTGMEVPKLARQRLLDDVTDGTGQVFLAHMMQCCRCHDHKFDPLPTRDYYSLQAVFATTQLAERSTPFLEEENCGFDGEDKYLKARRTHYQQMLKELDAKQTLELIRRWYQKQGLEMSVLDDAVARLVDNKGMKEEEIRLADIRRQMTNDKVEAKYVPPKDVGFGPEDFGRERIARKGLERLKWSFDRYEPFALAVYSGLSPELTSVYTPLRMPENPMKEGVFESIAILAGGDPFSPTIPVSSGVLSVVTKMQQRDYRLFESAPSESTANIPNTPQEPVVGRRLKLAEWIASSENPLTSRVMANRLWQWHFGKGVAGNPNNFGATGKKPTHPELLDWLAGELMRGDWSIKRMHRLIMSSQAYQRSSTHPAPPLVSEKDPTQDLYASFLPRRLAAEEIRDSMLAASGEINLEVGGVPVYPEMNLEAALQPRMVMGTFAEAWQPSPLPEQRHRRSLYAMKIRGLKDPFADVFNVPSSDLSCEGREASTVTPQVFSLFNSAISYDRALAMAKRLLDRYQSTDEVLEEAFLSVYGREATQKEKELCHAHWTQMTQRHEELSLSKPESPESVVREAVDENTGEIFTFVEPLEAARDFVPDLKPADVSAEVRGLAEVCLVLMNSNEFVYVY